jgi:hypothetical protein
MILLELDLPVPRDLSADASLNRTLGGDVPQPGPPSSGRARPSLAPPKGVTLPLEATSADAAVAARRADSAMGRVRDLTEPTTRISFRMPAVPIAAPHVTHGLIPCTGDWHRASSRRTQDAMTPRDWRRYPCLRRLPPIPVGKYRSTRFCW